MALNILVLGGVSFNTNIYLDELPQPKPQTVFSRRFHETVGSTGAGDAFFAGVLYGYHHHLSWLESLRVGTVVSGYAITSLELAHPGLTEKRLRDRYQEIYGRSL